MSVPSSELGPPPSPQASVPLPVWTQRGEEQHSLAVKGMGGPSSYDWKEAWHSMRAEGLERLSVSAKVATALGSIAASSDTVKSEGRQMNQC